MNKDPLFKDAAGLIVRNQKASTSLLQRKLKLGFPRATLLMNQLEAAGIIQKEQPENYEVIIKTESQLEDLFLALDKA